MAYNTNTYFVFFMPAVMIFYQLTPKKYRYITLLLASMVFFLLISKYLIAWTILTTAITYFGGILIDKYLKLSKSKVNYKGEALSSDEKKVLKKKFKKKAKNVTTIAVLLVFFILAGLKYTQFTIDTIYYIINGKTNASILPFAKILLPIGISFYTLQAIGYLLDIYWKRIEAEHNFLHVALFMFFFPTLMEGPILRWEDIKDQMFLGEAITGESFIQGAVRIVFGLFKRMIISDRLNMMIIFLYKDKASFQGLMIVTIAVVTTIQLYMEFSGTIDIVIGSARIFNIVLPENFRQPFMSRSAAEFWRRWHITLGVWLKNYVFYPASTSKMMKQWGKFGRKHCGKYITMMVTSFIALFPVWLINGLWHGPKWPYIIYGMYYLVILMLEIGLEPVALKVYEKLHLDKDGIIVRHFQMYRTWLIIFLGEMLFRANTLEQFCRFMKNMFEKPWDGGFFAGRIIEVGLDAGDVIVATIGTIIIFIIDWKLEKDPELLTRIPSLPIVKRWSLYYLVIFTLIIFGAYGAGYQPADLIYAGF